LDIPLDRRIYRYLVEGTPDTRGDGERSSSRGRIRVSDPQVEQSWSWTYSVSPGSLEQQVVALEPAVDQKASAAPFRSAFHLRELWRETRAAIAHTSLRQTLDGEIDQLRRIYEEAREPMGILLGLSLPVPEVHRTVGGYVLGGLFRKLAPQVHTDPAPLPQEWWEEVRQAVEENRRLSLTGDAAPLARALTERITVFLDRALSEPDREQALLHVALAYETLFRADRLELPVIRTGLEPRVYDLVLRFREELRDLTPEEPPQPDDRPMRGPAALWNLAGHANLQLQAILGNAPLRAGMVSLSTGGKKAHA
jgi:hypothetical protein